MATAILVKDKVLVRGEEAIIPYKAEVWLRKNKGKAFVPWEDVYFGKLIRNGEAMTKTGYRQIVIDKFGEPTKVVRKINTGYMPERSTYQVKSDSDIVLRIDWGNLNDPYEIMEQVGDRLIPYDFRVEPSAVAKKWLKAARRGASFLTLVDEDK